MTGIVMKGEALVILLFGGTSSEPDTTAIQSRKTMQVTEIFFIRGFVLSGIVGLTQAQEYRPHWLLKSKNDCVFSKSPETL